MKIDTPNACGCYRAFCAVSWGVLFAQDGWRTVRSMALLAYGAFDAAQIVGIGTSDSAMAAATGCAVESGGAAGRLSVGSAVAETGGARGFVTDQTKRDEDQMASRAITEFTAGNVNVFTRSPE